MGTAIGIAVGVLVLAGIVWFVLRRKRMGRQFTDEQYEKDYEAKQAALERILGPMHEVVGHAIIPFQIGGAVDMYYFPNGIPGTGFATMELIEPDGSGPKPNHIGTYELVAFTRQRMSGSDEKNEGDPFTRIDQRIWRILTRLAFYSMQAVLTPGETCEIPWDDSQENTWLILDEYTPDGKAFEFSGRKHCLLLVMEVFRSEMDHAREHGSDEVLAKLKRAGHYPYSDLDRQPVC